MKPADNIKKLVRQSHVTTDPDADDRILSDALADISTSVRRQPNVWKTVMKSRSTKFAAATVLIMVGVIIGTNQVRVSIASVAWADVAEHFRSVPFFSAVIYMKKNVLAEPEQVELWMRQGGYVRMRLGSQVVFARQGKVTKAFDLKSRKEVEPKRKAIFLLEKLGLADSFSLETVIDGISAGKLADVTPLINAEAVISEDLVVFDIQPDDGHQWLRVWALRESKLPVQIRLWDPWDGSCVDVFMSYAKEQPEVFFDPNAFSTRLTDQHSSETNLAYAFLKDPGGKPIVPKTLDEHEAFQVVTQTIDGQRWSLADHRNKVVLLTFWSRSIMGLDVHKKIYEEFGGRDDFRMVGVALDPDSDNVKAHCQREGIGWIQLHERGRPWKNENGMILHEPDNSLAQAFGVKWAQIWLVRKDGSMNQLDPAFLRDAVDAALLDMMSWPSLQSITETLYHKGSQGSMTQKEVEQVFGKPESVGITLEG